MATQSQWEGNLCLTEPTLLKTFITFIDTQSLTHIYTVFCFVRLTCSLDRYTELSVHYTVKGVCSSRLIYTHLANRI